MTKLAEIGAALVETKNASIDTLSVTIRALHVSAKQMTLAVFRQLPVADAYNEDGTLAELEHWGIVRYQVKDEGDLWVVASKDGVLYRCDTNTRHYFRGIEYANRSLTKILQTKNDYEIWKARRQTGEWVNRPYSLIERDVHEPGNEIERLLRGEIEHWQLEVSRAKNAERSLPILLALPQLFIAV